MIFKINSKSLLSALNLTAKGINASTVSDTSNYHFKKTDAGLEISTCNLEISMQTCIDVATTDPIDILIPGEKLVRLLSSLPDQFVTFTIGDDNSISIKAISGAYELSGYSAENFPIIKTETNLDVTVPAEDLTEAIYATAFARSVEPTMQVFTGLSINIAKDRMVFAGCNLMVLSVFNLKGKFKPLNILLPPVIVNTIGALNMQGDCKISYSENSICFEYSNLIVKSLLFDEKYRDYMGIVPKDSPVKAMVSRVELLGSLKRVLEFSNKEKRINIESVNGILNIIGEDTAYKQRASESIGISGGNIDIGLNGAFLAESLTRLSSESVEIAYTAFDKPILITEPGESENFIMIMAALKI